MWFPKCLRSEEGQEDGGEDEGWASSLIVDCWLLSITCHMSHIWFTSKIIWKLMYEHSNLDFEMEKFWPKTYTIVKLERLVETTKTSLCSVCKFLKWTLTENWTAVTVLIGLNNFRSWSVLVWSGLSLFPVLRLDLQTLLVIWAAAFPMARTLGKPGIVCWIPSSKKDQRISRNLWLRKTVVYLHSTGFFFI